MKSFGFAIFAGARSPPSTAWTARPESRCGARACRQPRPPTAPSNRWSTRTRRRWCWTRRGPTFARPPRRSCPNTCRWRSGFASRSAHNRWRPRWQPTTSTVPSVASARRPHPSRFGFNRPGPQWPWNATSGSPSRDGASRDRSPSRGRRHRPISPRGPTASPPGPTATPIPLTRSRSSRANARRSSSSCQFGLMFRTGSSTCRPGSSCTANQTINCGPNSSTHRPFTRAKRTPISSQPTRRPTVSGSTS